MLCFKRKLILSAAVNTAVCVAFMDLEAAF